MLINVVAQDPDLRVIEKIIKIINNDGLIVIPTDTIYAFATSMKSKKGLERLAKIKKNKIKKC
jgi:tRNA A37 threonylcarbamoyladenosine synthetase subunit TsaC/SUA5/YrdC